MKEMLNLENLELKRKIEKLEDELYEQYGSK